MPCCISFQPKGWRMPQAFSTLSLVYIEQVTHRMSRCDLAIKCVHLSFTKMSNNTHLSPIRCQHPTVIYHPYAKNNALQHLNYVTPGGVVDLSKDPQQYIRIRDHGFCLSYPGILEVDQYYIADRFTGETYPMFLVVPCGHCDLCKDEKAKEWAFRAHCECAESKTTPLYLTCTYNPESLPLDGVKKEHVQLFFKRLRIKLQREGYDCQIRYFACSEYGQDENHTLRPHYHIMLWGFPFLDDLYLLNEIKTRDFIEDCWEYGFVKTLPLLKGGASYVLKYMRKEQKIPKGQNPVFYLYSRRPGLGSKTCERYNTHYIENPQDLTMTVYDPWTSSYYTAKLPQYFKNKYWPSACKVIPQNIRETYKHLYNIAMQSFFSDNPIALMQLQTFFDLERRFVVLPRPYYDKSVMPDVALSHTDQWERSRYYRILTNQFNDDLRVLLNYLNNDYDYDIIMKIFNSKQLRAGVLLARDHPIHDIDVELGNLLKKRELAIQRWSFKKMKK